MSLDVSLTRKKWISYDKGETLDEEIEEVYSANITHNLGEMAREAGIYEALWRPYRLKSDYFSLRDDKYEYEFEGDSITIASEIIPIIEDGLGKLKANPKFFKTFDSENGWGTYDNFVPFVENYLNACKENPNCFVVVDR